MKKENQIDIHKKLMTNLDLFVEASRNLRNPENKSDKKKLQKDFDKYSRSVDRLLKNYNPVEIIKKDNELES